MQTYNLFSLNIVNEKNFTQTELFYFKTLNYVLECFNNLNDEKPHQLQLYLSESTFLIGSRNEQNQINPFAFIDEHNNILFDVNIELFRKEINKFINNYLKPYIINGLSEEAACSKAMKDYKNDKLDFYLDTKIDLSYLIKKQENNMKSDNRTL